MKFIISTRTMVDYPDLATACAESASLGEVPGVIDVFVEELTVELENAIIADHEAYEEDIGGTGVVDGGSGGCVEPQSNVVDMSIYFELQKARNEREQTGKVFDLAAFKNRNKH